MNPETSSPGIKTSGARREFGTGAHRDANDGKGRMDLLPWLALIRVSKHYQKGGATYGDDNWRNGIPRRALLDSAMRHGAKALMGWTDEDHLAAMAWNILCALEFEEIAARPNLLDTVSADSNLRPPPKFPKPDELARLSLQIMEEVSRSPLP